MHLAFSKKSKEQEKEDAKATTKKGKIGKISPKGKIAPKGKMVAKKEMPKKKQDDSEWRNMTLAKNESKSEVDETILKLAGVYK